MENYRKNLLSLFTRYKNGALIFYGKNKRLVMAASFICIILFLGIFSVLLNLSTQKHKTTPQTSSRWQRLSDKTQIKETFQNLASSQLTSFSQLDSSSNGFSLKLWTQKCEANNSVTITFNWETLTNASSYRLIYAPKPLDPLHPYASLPNIQPGKIIQGFSNNIEIEYQVYAVVNGIEIPSQNGTFIEKTWICPSSSPSITISPSPTATPSSQYKLTTQFDKATYKVGDTMKFCYHIDPENTPFHVKVDQTAPSNQTIFDEDDNGVGGGDCITGTAESSDVPKITLHTTITINGKKEQENDTSTNVTGTTPSPSVSAATNTPTSKPVGNNTTPTTAITSPTATVSPPPCTSTTPTPDITNNSPLDTEEWNFLRIINQHRQSIGRGLLKESVKLTNSAKWMSNDMATRNSLPANHIDSLGRQFQTRMAAFGYTQNAGENIAWAGPTGQNVFDAWFTSTQGHKEEMETASRVAIGVSRIKATSGSNWYWTADFGDILDQEITPPVSQTTPTTPPCANPTGNISPTPNPNATTLSLAITLPGIGKVTGDNASPKTNTRSIQLTFESASANPVNTSGTLTYNSSSGNFEGGIDISNVIPSTYSVKGKLTNTLSKVLSSALVISSSTKQYQISPQTFILGDIDNDDALSVQDYNNFVSCYKNLSSCSGTAKSASDLNDNGGIDLGDLNILQRGFKQIR